MRAALVEKPHAPVGIAKRDEVLAEEAHAHRRAVALGPLSKKFLMKITLDKAIKNIEFQPLKDNNSIYPLNFNVTKLAENSFCVNYDFQYNKIRINSGDLDILNQIYDTFNSKIHETILIHL
jgi:hypothetical protein